MIKKVVIGALAFAVLIVIIASCSAGSDKPSSGPAQGVASSAAKKVHHPPYTLAQRNAISAAKDYLSAMGFSRAGLIEQLSSQYGDGYAHADAVFAVDHLTVDWNKQAVRTAKEYLSTGHFSRAGLIEQLSSAAGSRYTHAQAVYAANVVGL